MVTRRGPSPAWWEQGASGGEDPWLQTNQESKVQRCSAIHSKLGLRTGKAGVGASVGHRQETETTRGS